MTIHDIRFLVTLAHALRLAQRRETARVLRQWEVEQRTPAATVHINMAEEEL